MRFAVAGLFAVGALLCLQGRAQALTEFCPASVTWHTLDVGPVSRPVQTSQLVALELDALGSRSLNGLLGIQTSQGWYLAQFPRVALTEHDNTFSTPQNQQTRIAQYYSTPIYVSFPTPVHVLRLWVAEAQTQGDSAFGWDAKGRVLCNPPTGAVAESSAPARVSLWHGPARAELRAPPSADSSVIDATLSMPPAGLSCAQPFAPAKMLKLGALEFPLGEPPGTGGTVTVDAAIDASGKLVDAWLWMPTTNHDFNAAALAAVRGSTFQAGRSLCHAVPGTYLLEILFASP